jgi:cytoskeleton protein RodZ
MRGISLHEIAEATRISTRFLEALENETWDRLPGGVFNRGFVRTVARFLGLEEESLLAEYSLAKGEPNAPPPVPSDLPAQPPSAKQKVSWVALAVLPAVLALAAGGWLGWKWFAARQAKLNAAAASLPAVPTPPPAPSNLWSSSADEAGTAAQPAESAPASTSPWSNATGNLQLTADAASDTTLTITADGQPVFTGTIYAGERRKVSAKTTLTVEAQDAGAIHLELNGQALPPIGPSGQPGKITLGPPVTSDDAGGHD